MNISFGMTTPALMARQKTETRREWAEKTQISAQRIAHRGDLFEAYSKGTRQHGKRIAMLRILEIRFELSNLATPIPNAPRTQELLDQLTHYRGNVDAFESLDWTCEGFEYLTKHGHRLDGMTPAEYFIMWHAEPRPVTVITFEVVGDPPCIQCGRARGTHTFSDRACTLEDLTGAPTYFEIGRPA